MIEHYRIGLLTHPVTKKYLDYKWRTYGRIYYTISILPFILFLSLLTTEIFYVYYFSTNAFSNSNMVARSNSSCSEAFQFNLTKLQNDGYVDATLATTNFFWNSNLRTNATRLTSIQNLGCQCYPLYRLNVVDDKELYIIFPLLTVTLGYLLFQIYKIIKQPILYWFSAVNLFELATLLVTVTLREGTDFGINLDRSALALFLGYGALFLQFRRYAWSGLYVTMFLEVISSMIKAILVFLPILLAYMIIFFLMTSPIKGFSDIIVSMVRIPVMLVGELDFYDSFLAEAVCYRNKYIIYIILTLFIFGITISLANLLIGLAVGDIDNILKQAVVSKSIEQVNWLTDFELGPIFPLFKRWTHWESLMVYPNRKRHLVSKIVANIDVFGIFSQQYTTQNELNSDITDPNLLFLIGLKEENNNLKMQLQGATDEISNLQTSFNKVFAVVQKIDQKIDMISPLDESQRTLPKSYRSPVLEKRLKITSLQSTSQ
ncbi:hypothetical protein LOD99_13881 [Oopsacas minuta]|uniref:Uncharacterized protein n=1 Tax=Oopsacas minuta TaxID=111878 RepID=A0AAV7KHF3_9METZ|nr:hypothetical protein LOD99_13881 [Oopsacas minuta]